MANLYRYVAVDANTQETICQYFQYCNTPESDVLTEALFNEFFSNEPEGAYHVWQEIPRKILHCTSTEPYDLEATAKLLADVEKETFAIVGSDGEESGGHYEFLDAAIEHLEFCESYPRVDSTQVVFSTQLLEIL